MRDGRGDYGYRFDLLKAYLMLTRHPERFNLDFIQSFAKRDWQEHSGSVLPEMRARLARHTAALFQNPLLERSDTVDSAPNSWLAKGKIFFIGPLADSCKDHLCDRLSRLGQRERAAGR